VILGPVNVISGKDDDLDPADAPLRRVSVRALAIDRFEFHLISALLSRLYMIGASASSGIAGVFLLSSAAELLVKTLSVFSLSDKCVAGNYTSTGGSRVVPHNFHLKPLGSCEFCKYCKAARIPGAC